MPAEVGAPESERRRRQHDGGWPPATADAATTSGHDCAADQRGLMARTPTHTIEDPGGRTAAAGRDDPDLPTGACSTCTPRWRRCPPDRPWRRPKPTCPQVARQDSKCCRAGHNAGGMPPVVSGWIGALPAAPAAEPARIAVITATIPADSAPSQGRHRSRRRVEGRAETRGLADKPSAINPPDTAPRNTLARPFAPVIAADRAPCKTKCSVVTNVTTAGLSSSGIPAARPL